MKHNYFYLYQSPDILFTSACRAIGILLDWVMIQHYQLKVALGWFISMFLATASFNAYINEFFCLANKKNKNTRLLIRTLNNRLGVRLTTMVSILSVGFSLSLILFADNIYALFLGLLFAGSGVVVYNINTTKIRCPATPSELRNSFESIFLAVCILPIPAGVALSTRLVNSGNLALSLALFSLLIFASALAI